MARHLDLPKPPTHQIQPRRYSWISPNSTALGNTFWTIYFRFPSFPLSALLSRDAFTLALTFCRSWATSLTLTSDSSNAAVISFRIASRTLSKIQNRKEGYRQRLRYFLVDNWCSIQRRKSGIKFATQISQNHRAGSGYWWRLRVTSGVTLHTSHYYSHPSVDCEMYDPGS